MNSQSNIQLALAKLLILQPSIPWWDKYHLIIWMLDYPALKRIPYHSNLQFLDLIPYFLLKHPAEQYPYLLQYLDFDWKELMQWMKDSQGYHIHLSYFLTGAQESMS